MADGVGFSEPPRRSLEFHEAALFALGATSTIALLIASHRLAPVSLEVSGLTILYASVISLCRVRISRFYQRTRFLAAFAFSLWFYCSVARIIPALGPRLRDGALLGIDEAMFGQTPAVLCEGVAGRGLTDVLSFCYLTYHFYLVIAVAHAAVILDPSAERLGAYLFTGFAVGFAGYLLVPAVGPERAYPELFHGPLPGGTPTRLIASVVAKGTSVYDVFPSLHVLITCILLDHDWRRVRPRFWIMILPSLGLLVSTFYLRYHYGVDILAGLLLFLVIRQTFLKAWRRPVTLPE